MHNINTTLKVLTKHIHLIPKNACKIISKYIFNTRKRQKFGKAVLNVHVRAITDVDSGLNFSQIVYYMTYIHILGYVKIYLHLFSIKMYLVFLDGF